MLPVVDADQWEANLATAREADATFDTELLRRAQEWQKEAEEAEHERENSGDVVVDVDVDVDAGFVPDDQEKERPIVDETASSASTGLSSLNGRGPPLQGEERMGPLNGGASPLQGDGGGDSSQTTQVNGADADPSAAANTGLVGIMFDAAV